MPNHEFRLHYYLLLHHTPTKQQGQGRDATTLPWSNPPSSRVNHKRLCQEKLKILFYTFFHFFSLFCNKVKKVKKRKVLYLLNYFFNQSPKVHALLQVKSLQQVLKAKKSIIQVKKSII